MRSGMADFANFMKILSAIQENKIGLIQHYINANSSNPFYIHTLYPEEILIVHAAKFASLEIMNILLNTPGFDINALDEQGFSALTSAVSRGDECVDVVQRLLMVEGINPSIRPLHGYEHTPLTLAAANRSKKIVIALLEKIESVEDLTCKAYGQTAEEIAISMNRIDIAELIRARIEFLNRRNIQVANQAIQAWNTSIAPSSSSSLTFHATQPAAAAAAAPAVISDTVVGAPQAAAAASVASSASDLTVAKFEKAWDEATRYPGEVDEAQMMQLLYGEDLEQEEERTVTASEAPAVAATTTTIEREMTQASSAVSSMGFFNSLTTQDRALSESVAHVHNTSEQVRTTLGAASSNIRCRL